MTVLETEEVAAKTHTQPTQLLSGADHARASTLPS